MSSPIGYPRRTLGLRDRLADRGAGLPADQGQPLPWTWSALATRGAVLLAGAAVGFVPPHPKSIALIGLLIGLAIAIASPDRGGAPTAVIAGIGGWFACYGAHGQPPTWRVLAFACALYLLHTSTALAAAVGLTSRLDRLTVTRWVGRSALHLAIAGVLAALSYASTSGQYRSGSHLLELIGLVGAVLVLSVVGWLFSRLPRS